LFKTLPNTHGIVPRTTSLTILKLWSLQICNMDEKDIRANRIPKGFLHKERRCEKLKCQKEGTYSSKIGYFCLDHILDYDMLCPSQDCPRNGLPMDKLISKIEKDIKGDLHQIFQCQSCNYRHDHTVHV